MKQVLVTPGGVVVDEVPAPVVEPGVVVVATAWSAISAGTELSGIATAETPLWRRAAREPARAMRAAKVLAQGGVGAVRERLAARNVTGTPTGYSMAGVVLEVGAGIHDLRPGDRVACAGAGVANHAEVVSVPRNLTVKVPPEVSLRDASAVTLGAIALQGVRRAAPTLGETFGVIGMGILGQLTSQLLRSAGARTVVIDVDRSRLELAATLGADVVVSPDEDASQAVDLLTGGVGLDGVIITASTPSDEVVSTAFRLCRKKGRVVLVGDVGLDLDRADIYEKELDFLVSTSYGPGRYDRSYEEDGLDYPLGHVRWTENRNMQEVLRQIADGRLLIGPLVSKAVPIGDASGAYEALRNDDPRPLLVLLSYDGSGGATDDRAIKISGGRPTPQGGVRIALVGAGTFASAVHLPNLRAIEGATLHAVCSRTGATAVATARAHGAAYATTDVEEVLQDPDVDAVVIATRHHLHAELVCRALRAGKHVFVEKPLALTEVELEAIDAAASEVRGSGLVLTTGYNRRFAPPIASIREFVQERREPLVLSYRMDAGHLPGNHWVHGEQGGGRNLGEACHVYDLFTALTGSEIASGKNDVVATRLRPASGWARGDDNFCVALSFADGSIASLVYTAVGGGEHGKERLEVFCDGHSIVMDDFRMLKLGDQEPVRWSDPDKGHELLMSAFVQAVRGGGDAPVPYWEQRQAAAIALRVESYLGHPSERPKER